MEYVRLGKTGLMVSPICLGTMALGPPVEKGRSIEIIEEAIELGINFIDTANCYGGYSKNAETSSGETEELVGEAIQGKREEVVLITKVGVPIGYGPQERGLSATHILRELDASLDRLGTNYIDLYLIHWPDRYTSREETLRAINTAVSQGKVRYFGISNHSAWQFCEFFHLADKRNWPLPVVSEIPYSMLRRDYHDDLQFYDERDIAVTPYQPLQGGLLTGKYSKKEEPPDDSRAVKKPEWIWDFTDEVFEEIEELKKLAQEVDVPLSQYALAWALEQKSVSSVIVGSTKLNHLEEALEASEIKIPSDHFEEINRIIPPSETSTYERLRGEWS